jgi:hypothetical protein
VVGLAGDFLLRNDPISAIWVLGGTGLAIARVARGGGVSYRRAHQAWMITSCAMPVSMV